MTRTKARPPQESAHTLPAHWPRYTTEEYYAWMMARMPSGAIAADWSKHKPHNSYSPLFWYEDQARQCTDCGTRFTFTKEEQRHWYEELKFPIQVRGSGCPDCRRKIRNTKAAQKEHMEEMAQREPHPHEAFFKRRQP